MNQFVSFLFSFAILATISSCKNETPSATPLPKANDSTQVVSSTTSLGVAYIYGDSINKSYLFLVDARKELEAEENNMQARLKAKLQRAEQRAMELQQKASTMTQVQMQEAQLELQGLDIEMQQFQEKLATEFRKREVELQQDYIARVDSFLLKYNSDGRFDMILNYQQGGQVLYINKQLDITPDVLSGLNSEYAAELKTKAAASAK